MDPGLPPNLRATKAVIIITIILHNNETKRAFFFHGRRRQRTSEDKSVFDDACCNSILQLSRIQSNILSHTWRCWRALIYWPRAREGWWCIGKQTMQTSLDTISLVACLLLAAAATPRKRREEQDKETRSIIITSFSDGLWMMYNRSSNGTSSCWSISLLIVLSSWLLTLNDERCTWITRVQYHRHRDFPPYL